MRNSAICALRQAAAYQVKSNAAKYKPKLYMSREIVHVAAEEKQTQANKHMRFTTNIITVQHTLVHVCPFVYAKKQHVSKHTISVGATTP